MTDTDLLFYLGQIFKSLGGEDNQNLAMQTHKRLLQDRNKIHDVALKHVAQQHNMTVDVLINKVTEEKKDPLNF